MVPVVSAVVSLSLAVEVSVIEAGWVVLPVSLPVVLAPVVGTSPVPVMPAVVGSLAWLLLPVGSPVVLVAGPPPVVAAVSVLLDWLPPPPAARCRTAFTEMR